MTPPQTIQFGQEKQIDPNWQPPKTISFGKESGFADPSSIQFGTAAAAHQQDREAQAKSLGMNFQDPSTDSRMQGVSQNTFKNFASAVPGAITDTGKNIAQKTGQGYMAMTQGLGQDFQNLNQHSQDVVAGKKVGAAKMGADILSMGSHAVQGVFSPLTALFQQSAEGGAQALEATPGFNKLANSGVGDKVSNTVNSLNQKYEQIKQQNPTKAKAVEDAVNVIMSLVGEGKTNELGSTSVDMAKGAGDNINAGLNKGVELTNAAASKVAEVPGMIKEKVGAGLENRYVNQAQKEWSEPTKIAKPAYNKATEIFKNAEGQGHNIADTLVKNKINLSDHIDNGTYTTADTADKIRTDTAKMSKDMLRPSLEKADLTTPKTPVQDVIADARKNIDSNKGLTQETKDTLQSGLDKTELALTKQYPQGMSLSDLHDEKITRDLNSKYSPVGDIGTNNEAVKNKAVADATRKTLEAKAPAEVPIKQFNGELRKQYQAADYLDALNNKKVPVSVGSRIAKTTAKVAGAAVGHGLGGGILGGVGGYHIGGMVEGMLENLPNPVKNSFLKNLEVTNPEAFTKMQDYLKTPEVIPEVKAPNTGGPNIGLSIQDVSPKAEEMGRTLNTLEKQYQTKPTPQNLKALKQARETYKKLSK